MTRDVATAANLRAEAERMRRDWDAIARRNAYFGIYSDPLYDTDGEIDEGSFWETGTAEADRLLSMAPLGPAATLAMAEIGCGLGRMTQAFARRFDQVYAFDISAEMIARARRTWSSLDNVQFILGSGTDLQPLGDASVDFVCSFIVLQHVTDPAVVLNYIRETGRVLADNGLALLQFRTTTPTPRFYRVARQLEAGLRAGARRVIRRSAPPTGLEGEYGARYASWSGCAVSTAAVPGVASASGLAIESVRNPGTQYTFYTFRRRPRRTAA
jgi:SAM-dependent methyltransferase